MARVCDPCPRGSKTRAVHAAPDPATPRDALSIIRNAELDIINALKEKALEGSYLHAKFLFDYAGMTRAQALDESEPSLAELMLQELILVQETAPAAGNAGDFGNIRKI